MGGVSEYASRLPLTLTGLLPPLPGVTDKECPLLLPRAFFSIRVNFSLKGILVSVANNIHPPTTLL